MEPLAEIMTYAPSSAQTVIPTSDHGRRQELGRDLLVLAVAATLSLVAGLMINQLRDRPLPLAYAAKEQRLTEAVTRLGDNSAATPAPANDQVAGHASANGFLPENVDVMAVQTYVEAKRGLVLDARPEIFHRLGHIPGAVSLPREEFESAYARQHALLEERRGETIVVYCSSASCEDSQMVADALKKLGYAHISVFKGGWDEWMHAGLPEERK